MPYMCTESYDYPNDDGTFDEDIDLRDCAGFQNAFGRQ